MGLWRPEGYYFGVIYIYIYPGSRSDYKKNGLTRGSKFGNFLDPSAGQNVVELDLYTVHVTYDSVMWRSENGGNPWEKDYVASQGQKNHDPDTTRTWDPARTDCRSQTPSQPPRVRPAFSAGPFLGSPHESSCGYVNWWVVEGFHLRAGQTPSSKRPAATLPLGCMSRRGPVEPFSV